MVDDNMTDEQKATAVRKTELDRLALGALSDPSDDDSCVLCLTTMLVHDGCEPSPICDSCAQDAAVALAKFYQEHQDRRGG